MKFVDNADAQFRATGNDGQFQHGASVVRQRYGQPDPRPHCCYVPITQAKPFDILYFPPGITAIVNADDGSSSITPEIACIGIKNAELRLRAVSPNGGAGTELGERQFPSRIECRARLHF